MTRARPLNNATLHHAIITSLLDRCFAPNLEELCDRFSVPRQGIERALRELADYHGLVLHPASARIWVAHPFSTAPTNFLVCQGDKEWWGNCAWCSLGLVALLEGNATITTALGANDRQITIHVEDGEVVETDLLVHFPVPMQNVWDNIVYTCSSMLVFDSEAKIDAWCAKHRIAKGDVQPIAKVWRFASEWYGRHGDEDWRKWTAAEAAEIFARHGLTGPIWDLPSEQGRF
ncbi:MAG: alkylmercury lyase family protein [Hyphomicrobiaceae bacterium]